MEMLWRPSTSRQFLEEYVLPDAFVPLLCHISEDFDRKNEPSLYCTASIVLFVCYFTMTHLSTCWLSDNEHNEGLFQGPSSLSVVDSTIATCIKNMPSERNAGAVS